MAESKLKRDFQEASGADKEEELEFIEFQPAQRPEPTPPQESALEGIEQVEYQPIPKPYWFDEQNMQTDYEMKKTVGEVKQAGREVKQYAGQKTGQGIKYVKEVAIPKTVQIGSEVAEGTVKTGVGAVKDLFMMRYRREVEKSKTMPSIQVYPASFADIDKNVVQKYATPREPIESLSFPASVLEIEQRGSSPVTKTAMISAPPSFSDFLMGGAPEIPKQQIAKKGVIPKAKKQGRVNLSRKEVGIIRSIINRSKGGKKK